MTIGERIRKARKEKGWSQSELGKELGVTQQMIAQFENSKKNPKIETLERIATALNINVIDLLGDISAKPSINYDETKSIDYADAFCVMVESLGYKVEFRSEEDLYLILKQDEIICTFDTGDYFDLINRVLEEIKYYIQLKSFPSIDYMSDIESENDSDSE